MRFSGALISLIFISAIYAGDPRNDRIRVIKIPTRSVARLACVEFDKEIFQHSPSGFGAIRVRDSKGVIQSHLEVRPTQIRSEILKTYFSGKTLSAMPIKGGGFQIEVETGDDAVRPNGLRINTPLSDFENKITIFGLNNKGVETKLADGLLADYRSIVDYRVDSILFDAGEFQRFKILVAQPTIQQESALMELSRQAGSPNGERLNVLRRPFRIESIDFFKTNEVSLKEEPIRDELAPESVAFFVDKKNKTTVVDFETWGGPVLGVEIFPKTVNFSRKARLEYGTLISAFKTDLPEKESRMNWTIASRGTISQLDFQGHKSRNTRLECPENRQTKWRIVIENGDSPPVEVESVKILGGKVQFVFLAQPGENYQLEYGDSQSNSAVFDTAAIQAMLRAKVAPFVAPLGEVQMMDPGPEQKVDWFQWLMRQKAFFGVVVLVLASILGVTLFQAAKRVNAESEHPPMG